MTISKTYTSKFVNLPSATRNGEFIELSRQVLDHLYCTHKSTELAILDVLFACKNEEYFLSILNNAQLNIQGVVSCLKEHTCRRTQKRTYQLYSLTNHEIERTFAFDLSTPTHKRIIQSIDLCI